MERGDDLYLWSLDQKFTSFTKFNILPGLRTHNLCLKIGSSEKFLDHCCFEVKPVSMESAALWNLQLPHLPYNHGMTHTGKEADYLVMMVMGVDSVMP